MTGPTPPRLDRDAVLEALQDQIDDLTAALRAQQKLIDAHNRVIVELARLAGLGAQDREQPPRPSNSSHGTGGGRG
jgi:hypothetical protein